MKKPGLNFSNYNGICRIMCFCMCCPCCQRKKLPPFPCLSSGKSFWWVSVPFPLFCCSQTPKFSKQKIFARFWWQAESNTKEGSPTEAFWFLDCLQRTTSWSLLGPGVVVGLTPNFMKGIHIFLLSIVGSFYFIFLSSKFDVQCQEGT